MLRSMRFPENPVFAALRALGAALAIALALCTCAVAQTAPTDHAFGFDMRYDDQDAEVLDYRYGDSNLPVRAPESAVREGKTFAFAGVHGPLLRGDFLYVKWRTRGSGEVYEDTVDLRRRLPADVTGYRIHVIIRGPQLYVYLVSPQRRPADMPPKGPEIYNYRIVTTIYPDEEKP